MCCSLAVSALLMMVLFSRMYFLVLVVWVIMALDMFMVCVRAVFESDAIMLGYPGGIASCAMMMAISSAELLHVWEVPIACGSAWMRASMGIVSFPRHSVGLC